MMTLSERMAATARAIEPILNRVVFSGPLLVELLKSDWPLQTPELRFSADSSLQLLSTSMVDRLAVDLQKLGHTRVGRRASGDRWQLANGPTFDLIQVKSDDSDPEQMLLEYATLLTLPLSLGEGLVVRIAGGPPTLAFECAAFERDGEEIIDSAALERVVLLLAGRPEIEHELASAPSELRSAITPALIRLARSDALQLLVQRAIPDALLLPAVATRVRDRLRRMAC